MAKRASQLKFFLEDAINFGYIGHHFQQGPSPSIIFNQGVWQSPSGLIYGTYSQDDIDALWALAEEPEIIDIFMTYPSYLFHIIQFHELLQFVLNHVEDRNVETILEEKYLSWVGIPTSVGLPFGSVEKVLSDELNKDCS
ncbi:hypothetical protein L2E82_44735 [Cichorium intybus]|uniref:Uncharacterized protein n=1 Tax=Cichorium intybus TaxID=13427 RepID=A0ACB8ZR93_CICIN|nr:hypothetical protein L2E82_44735 [Cichorium intybus]